jgi:hypothetical protein
LVNDTQRIVSEFLQSQDKEAVIEKTKTVEGADVYVTVMQRYLTGGSALLEKDVSIMSSLLSQKKGSWPALDGMKRRLNVFRAFLPGRGEGGSPVKTDL